MNGLKDDRDDDIRLPGRTSERRTALRDEAHGEEQDREFTLSTGTVLGIFFALALVCAVFFGFGYSMGRKSGQASAEASAPATPATSDVAVSKPSPGSPAVQSIPGYLSQSEVDAANRSGSNQGYKATSTTGTTTVVVPTAVPESPRPSKPTALTGPSPSGTVAAAPAIGTSAPVERRPADIRPATVAAAAPAAAAGSATTNYVQIAAVSHQEDADVLLSALKRRGYSVFARPGETDKLIHVQVGPFASRKDADAMRLRLAGDGYNAIVK